MAALLIIEVTCDDVRTAEMAIFAMIKYKGSVLLLVFEKEMQILEQ